MWATRFPGGSLHLIGTVHGYVYGANGDEAILNIKNPTSWILPRGLVYVLEGPDTTRNEDYTISSAQYSTRGANLRDRRDLRLAVRHRCRARADHLRRPQHLQLQMGAQPWRSHHPQLPARRQRRARLCRPPGIRASQRGRHRQLQRRLGHLLPGYQRRRGRDERQHRLRPLTHSRGQGDIQRLPLDAALAAALRLTEREPVDQGRGQALTPKRARKPLGEPSTRAARASPPSSSPQGTMSPVPGFRLPSQSGQRGAMSPGFGRMSAQISCDDWTSQTHGRTAIQQLRNRDLRQMISGQVWLLSGLYMIVACLAAWVRGERYIRLTAATRPACL